MKKRIAAVALVFLLAFSVQAIPDVPQENPEFTFARVKFNMVPDWFLSTREEPWHHDYPFSEDFVLTFLQEVTQMHTDADAYEIVDLDSPEIFHYPLLYFSEPGFMELTEKESRNLREWFEVGGFAWFDDFRGDDLDNLRNQLATVYPLREMVRLNAADPIFHTFYDIDALEMPRPYTYQNPTYDDPRFLGGYPEFWGMRDDHGRLILVACQNNDLGEFFEGVDRGEIPFAPAAKATRLMVNFLLYGMTH